MKFLVDYENTNLSGLSGIENLDQDDLVIIFHTNPNDKMPFELLAKIKCQLEFVCVSPGKQSLDMCLASRLGYLIGCKQGINAQLDYASDVSSVFDPEPEDIVIVSRDTDYLSMVYMWNSQYHQSVKTRTTISDDNNAHVPTTATSIPTEIHADPLSSQLYQELPKSILDSKYTTATSQTKKKINTEQRIRIEQMLKSKGLNKSEITEVFWCIDRDPKSPNYKSNIYELMCQILGDKSGRKTYQRLKTML